MSRNISRLFMAILALVAAALPAQAYIDPRGDGRAADTPAVATYAKVPLLFIENRGQVAEAVRYYLLSGDRTIWLADDAIWVTVRQPAAPVQRKLLPLPMEGLREGKIGAAATETRSATLKLSFLGANPHVRLEPLEALETHVSYLIGNDPSKWHTDVPVWSGVRYVNLYPGIDLEVSGRGGVWAWQVHAQPDANLADVQLQVEGANHLVLEGDQLRVMTAVGEFHLPLLAVDGAELSSAMVDGVVVRAPFVAPGTGVAAIAAADRPDDLLYATFLGGNGYDNGADIAVDGSGNTYVTGYAGSSDFPVTSGSYDTSYSNGDAFVAKLNADGTDLVYTTFLGGSSADYSSGIAIDSSGNAYVTGSTSSADFPAAAGPGYDTIYDAGGDAFAVKLNTGGTGLVYATFLGGNSADIGYDIAIDGSNSAYVAGYTESSGFPVTSGSYDTTYNGGGDAFVVKLNTGGTGLVYATFLGGSGTDYGSSTAVDGSGYAYITGYAGSSNFPSTPGSYDPSHNGDIDAFAVKLNTGGTGLVYATFLGGSSAEIGHDIAIDTGGNAYVTGETVSSDFPTTLDSYDTSYNGGYDAFVAKLNAGGTSLLYATFLGGGYWDYGYGIAVDTSGDAHITGETRSSDFPAGPSYDTSYNGGYDAFVAKLNAGGTSLLYATFLGGGHWDQGFGIAVDGSGNAYITGYTESPDFPAISGSYDPSFNASSDAFVVKLDVVPSVYLPIIRK